MKSVIVGTAGHIDHGKTALVKALTGIDADRLEEEKRRGITIDIGFAHLELDGMRLGFVDVPGHERFVRNMLAGIGGIDLVLLVVAADEGIMPQTREHFDICRLLSVKRGITVLTKSDTVDRETLDVVRAEVADFARDSFLEGAPIVAVSSLTGAGIDELKQTLATAAREVSARDSSALLRLPIDRVFTIKGFGTVVTGTLIAGQVAKEQNVEVLPGGRLVRVRNVQVHGSAAAHAVAGQRTALNLAGVAKDDLARGMMLVPPATFRTTTRADVSFTLLPGARRLKDRTRVHLHAFTSETVAEVVLHDAKELAPGATAFAQLRLADPLPLLPGDRFILRQFSPVVTIGGGVVIDAAPLRRKDAGANLAQQLRTLHSGTPLEILTARVARRRVDGLTVEDAVAETGWRREQILELAASSPDVFASRDPLLTKASFDEAQALVLDALRAYQDANPLAAGIGREELRERANLGHAVFDAVMLALEKRQAVQLHGDRVLLAGRGVVMKDDEAESKQQIEQAFATSGLKVPSLKEVLAGVKLDRVRAQQIVTLLLREKTLVKIADDLVFHRSALDGLRRDIQQYKQRSPRIDVAAFKDLTGVSRKYAIPLLEYLDRERVTRREGDFRVIL